MNAPVCCMCAEEQNGIVRFLWSEGAVVYECRHCGTFNEVPEIRAAKRSFAMSDSRELQAEMPSRRVTQR